MRLQSHYRLVKNGINLKHKGGGGSPPLISKKTIEVIDL